MLAIEQYVLGVKLGSGTFGNVIAGKHKRTGSQVAIKVMCKDLVDPDKVIHEISNHQNLCHPHIARLHHVIETNDEICMIMELVTGGDLFALIVQHVRVAESEARRLFQQIIDGVAYCHNCNVAHRDLKPENILLDSDMNVKIIDFGLSTQICAGCLLTESCGSLNYAAPELLHKNSFYEGPEVDAWACGVILYAMLVGCLPFDDLNRVALCKKIKLAQYMMPFYLSSKPHDLIVQLLTVDRQKRISIPQIKTHSWFIKCGPEQLKKKCP